MDSKIYIINNKKTNKKVIFSTVGYTSEGVRINVRTRVRRVDTEGV